MLLTSNQGKVFAFELSSQCLLTAWSPALSKGCGILVEGLPPAESCLADAWKSIQSHLGEGAGVLEWKLVAPAESSKRIEAFLLGKGAAIRSKYDAFSGSIKGFYDPSSGGIKVEGKAPARASKRTRVLIVDDSPTIRSLLTQIFSRDPQLEVVGAVDRPTQVEAWIEKTRPDVLTLDIHMPEMDGVTLLKKLLPRYPIPTVMISSISREEGPMVFSALEAGAVDYIQKPTMDQLDVMAPIMIEKIKTASHAQLKRTPQLTRGVVSSAGIPLDRFVLIGSSTGGTEALRAVLTRLPEEIPPILIVQHIPPVFSLAFAKRMNDLCRFEVKEAEDGDEILPKRVLIAPGGKQMKIAKRSGSWRVVIDDSAPVNRHKPSVDVLFDSAAPLIGESSVGIILTGMGGDGAKGLLNLKGKGARTIAQDEKSCVVFGMPREAIRLGAAEKVVSLDQIPEALIEMLKSGRRAA